MTTPGMHRLALSGGPGPHDVQVTLDGQPLHGVMSVRIDAGVRTLVTATVELDVAVDVDVTAVVEAHDATAREALTHLVEVLDNGTHLREGCALCSFARRVAAEATSR